MTRTAKVYTSISINIPKVGALLCFIEVCFWSILPIVSRVSALALRQMYDCPKWQWNNPEKYELIRTEIFRIFGFDHYRHFLNHGATQIGKKSCLALVHRAATTLLQIFADVTTFCADGVCNIYRFCFYDPLVIRAMWHFCQIPGAHTIINEMALVFDG